MPSPTIPEISKRLADELETILGLPLADGADRRPLHELGVDSISLVELLVMIEREFGLSLLEEGLAADDLRTIERIATAIHERLV